MPSKSKKRSVRRGRTANSQGLPNHFISTQTQFPIKTTSPPYAPISFQLNQLCPELTSGTISSRLLKLSMFTIRFYPVPLGSGEVPILVSVQIGQYDLATNIAVPMTKIIPLSTTNSRTLSYRATGSRWVNSSSDQSIILASLSITSTSPNTTIYADITTSFIIGRDVLSVPAQSDQLDYQILERSVPVTPALSIVSRSGRR